MRIQILLLACLMACKNNPNNGEEPLFKQTYHLEATTINDSIIWGAGIDIQFHNGKLYILTSPAEKHITVLDTNGEKKDEYISKGRGPNETISIKSFILDNDTIYISDRQTQLTKKGIIQHNQPNIELRTISNIPLSNVLMRRDNSLLLGHVYTSSEKHLRFLWLNENGDTISKYNEYLQQLEKFPGVESIYGYESRTSISPNGKFMVSGTIFGESLEIFDLCDNTIKKIHEKNYRHPRVEVKNNQIYPIDGITTFGYMDIYATNTHIYTLYCGDTEGRKVNKIAVFNWQGEAETLYTVDSDFLYSICLNTEETKIYAIGLNNKRETVILSYNIPDTGHNSTNIHNINVDTMSQTLHTIDTGWQDLKFIPSSDNTLQIKFK